jgi:hypothetical protein
MRWFYFSRSRSDPTCVGLASAEVAATTGRLNLLHVSAGSIDDEAILNGDVEKTTTRGVDLLRAKQIDTM